MYISLIYNNLIIYVSFPDLKIVLHRISIVRGTQISGAR